MIGDDAEGFWSPRTASVDWCEDNYVYSKYVAEMWNTVSSVPIAAMGMYGLYRGLKDGTERRFMLCFTLLVIVGLGSVGFHGTLLYTGQVLDEIPMVMTVTALTWCIFETTFEKVKNKWLPWAIVAYLCAFCVVYVTMPGYFFFFVLLFSTSVLYMAYRSYQLYNKSSHPMPRKLFWLAFGAYIGGTILFWIPGIVFCDTLKPLHLHAWFHLTSTVGSYTVTLFAIFIRYDVLKRGPEMCKDSLLPFVVAKGSKAT